MAMWLVPVIYQADGEERRTKIMVKTEDIVTISPALNDLQGLQYSLITVSLGHDKIDFVVEVPFADLWSALPEPKQAFTNPSSLTN